MLFVVKRDPVFKRKKAVSERISPQQKKLQDDFDVFQYLKNERNSHPVSLHITSVQIPNMMLSQKMVTQTSQRGSAKGKSEDSKQQIKQQKKSYFSLKLERFQKEFQDQQTKRKQEMLLKAQNMIKQDLEDIQRMTTKGKREFEERCNLYSKYYSDELMAPSGYRSEDMNMPTYKYSKIENQNKFRTILKPPPIQQQQLVPQEEFEQYKSNPDQIKSISDQLSKLKIKLIKTPSKNESSLFEAILKNDEFTLNKLLTDDSNLVNSRNRTQETPLHVACKRNQKQIVELLLKHHADEQKKDLWGQTPRQIAFKLRNLEILKILSYK